MDAVISRRAGMALLLEDEQFSSIHIENLDQVVTRQPSELPFLLGNATDLQSVEGVDLPHVISRLEREVAFEESLHLALMSLDSTLSSGTRQVAVEALEDLLSDDAIVRRLRGVLYAQPLPRGADIKGALAVSETDQTKLAFNLFNTLAHYQPAIIRVREAWEFIPTQAFGSEETRVSFQRVAVEEGLFHDLALSIADSSNVDRFLL